MLNPTVYSVPELAETHHIGESKVRAFIESGELRAVNLALRPGQRPRWQITAEAWEAFTLARSNAGRVKARQRRRTSRVNPLNVTQYI